MMHYSQNSPTHRSGNLLCADLSRRVQSDNYSPLGHPPSTQSLATRNFGQPTPLSTAPTAVVPMLAPHRNHMTHTANVMFPGYYADPLFMRTQNPPQFSGGYPAAQSSFPSAQTYEPFMPAYPPINSSFDFVGLLSEPYAVQQPPVPPAAPEQSVVPIQPFHSYPCRWLDGPQCDGSAPGRNREMGEHLRVFHRFVGHERDTVQCQWENCGQVMQRMNVPRHIVSRHLLAAASCRFCGKRFSRPDVVGRHERTCDGVSPVSNGTLSRV